MRLGRYMTWRGFAAGAIVVVAGLLLRGPIRAKPASIEGGKPFRVEVLNGSGVRRAGQGLAEALRARGFDVVDIRNADRMDYAETLVLDRVGEPKYADAVARELGVQSSYRQRNEDLLLEVTVILGRDLASRYGEGS
ncbi:MAG: LytR C-terminal domain-containing protein [bacterium]